MQARARLTLALSRATVPALSVKVLRSAFTVSLIDWSESDLPEVVMADDSAVNAAVLSMTGCGFIGSGV